MKSDSVSIRVLYVINGLGTGGAERSLVDLLGPLKERGVETTVACLYHRAVGVEKEVMNGVDIRFLGSSMFNRLRSLRRLIGEQSPDVIHTTIFESDLLGRLASAGTRTPVVTSIVNTSYNLGSVPHPDVSLPKLAIARWIDGATARKFNTRFHALTRTVKDAAVDALRLSPEIIDVIPRGRDPQRLGQASAGRRSDARAALGFDDREVILLSVGRREHQKGQIYAIEALKLLSLRTPETSKVLLVAGREGAAADRLAKRATEIGVADRVHFLGHRRDVPDLMAASDVLIFPSLYEGFGGTLIEAMALGLPIVASDIPSLREVASNVAVLVPRESTHDLASAVERLLTDPALRQKLIDAGRVRFAEHYEIGRIADRMRDFYRTAIAND